MVAAAGVRRGQLKVVNRRLENPPGMAGFSHVLVPLDGTKVSELALQAAQKAVAEGGQMTLLRVVKLEGDHLIPDESDRVKIRDQQISPASLYLEEIKETLRRRDIRVAITIASGSPAETIVRLAEEKQVDAIAMCTHTEAHLRQLLLGSVAQTVVRGSRVPVILVHPS